jgi:hypothetical protein
MGGGGVALEHAVVNTSTAAPKRIIDGRDTTETAAGAGLDRSLEAGHQE